MIANIILLITFIYIVLYFYYSKFNNEYFYNFNEHFVVNFIDRCTKTNIDVLYKKCKHLSSVKSKFQKIDVYKHNRLGNILVIDGDLQLTEFDEKNYHEMIVHVPLNYLHNAKNVLIIGGGDGGTLYQTLKHKNLENIYNLEIDIEVIRTAKKYFSNLGSSFDDERANVIIDDASKWVKKQTKRKRFSNYFDVVILDSTDFGASETLFTKEFYYNLKKLMKKKSIFVLNYESLGWYKENLYKFKNNMGDFFNHVYIYQVYQPTFHSGHYSFAFLSDQIHPRNSIINWDAFYKKKLNLHYYNKKIHFGSFSLPTSIINKKLRKEKQILGIGISIDIQNSESSLLDSINNINIFFNQVLSLLKLNEIKRIHYKFKPYGVTMISLLKESHLSIHTWPEKESACIDIFSCGKFKYDTPKLLGVIKKYFKTSNIKINQVNREVNK